jgi:hypothetical protein
VEEDIAAINTISSKQCRNIAKSPFVREEASAAIRHLAVWRETRQVVGHHRPYHEWVFSESATVVPIKPPREASGAGMKRNNNEWLA